jgi:8-oxo-dGTP diphosphatase
MALRSHGGWNHVHRKELHVPREYPSAPVVGVGAIIVRKARVLLVQRGNEPNRGQWSIPGGVVELGETLTQAVEREVREECGLQVQAQDVLSTFDLIQRDPQGRIWYHYVLIDLRARYVSGEATPSSDALDVRWVEQTQLDRMDLVPRLLPVLHRALRETRAGEFDRARSAEP